MPKQHSRTLRWVLKTELGSPLYGVEVGVWKGGNSEALLTRFKALNMLMVDRYSVLTDEEKALADDRMSALALEDFDSALLSAHRVQQKFCDRCLMFIGTSEQAAKYVADASQDFAFIDASHDYQSVQKDIAYWLPKIRQGGVLCGHDYGGSLPEVKQAVDDYFGKDQIRHKNPGYIWWVKS